MENKDLEEKYNELEKDVRNIERIIVILLICMTIQIIITFGNLLLPYGCR